METYAGAAARQEGMKISSAGATTSLANSVKPTEPVHKQIFIARNPKVASEDEFECWSILRKTISAPSAEHRTITRCRSPPAP